MKITSKKILTLVPSLLLMAFASGLAPAQSPGNQGARDLVKVNRFTLDIIPPSSGVQFYREGIVFLSTTRSETRMLDSHTSFGKIDTYYAVPFDTATGNPVLFSPALSWQVPCEAMTFNSDYTEMYYTRKPSHREPEKIYMARYELAKNKKQRWVSDTKPLSFCSDRSLYSHPALSPDGEKMVFSSNRIESLGGFDLFISYKEGSEWSAPINLGNLINTKGNELTPFLDQDNNLYYSSDGLPGSGGYDIFFCRYNRGKWEKPVNMTELINSPDDDLAFKLSRIDGKSAFYTTRYKSVGKNPQLFKVTLNDRTALGKAANLQEAFRLIAQTVTTPEEKVVPVAVKEEKPAPVVKETVAPTEAPQQKVAISEKVPEPAPVQAMPQPAADPGQIVFRVQYQSVSTKNDRRSITIGGKPYDVFEYFSNGTYKYCAGEFPSPAAAAPLQAQLRRDGYSDAFVVAFRNNERVTGSLQNISSQAPAAQRVQAQEVPTPADRANQDRIVYRVQFASYMNPRGSYEKTFGGTRYMVFEYMYNGACRACAGEFSSSAAAAGLQRQIMKEGYPDAFVIATRGNERVINP